MVLILLFALIGPVLGGHEINVEDIVRRAASAMQADWAAAPGFAFVQRDVTTSKGISTSKTHRVFMIEGSDYYMPIAIDDQPLPADQQKLEFEKLKSEVGRRSQETPEQARHRAAQYRKTREQNGILIQEFTKAFDFTLAGEEVVNGHNCYLLDAKPNPDYRPPNRTAKVLTGMQGRLWIDKDSFHWVKAEAEVLKPVSIFGLFARVLPGTRMELEMTPVTDSVWLVSRFAVDLRLAILWRRSIKATESTFSDYRPAAAALAEALASEKIGARLSPSTETGLGMEESIKYDPECDRAPDAAWSFTLFVTRAQFGGKLVRRPGQFQMLWRRRAQCEPKRYVDLC